MGTLLRIASCVSALICLWSQIKKEIAIHPIKWLVIIGKLIETLKNNQIVNLYTTP